MCTLQYIHILNQIHNHVVNLNRNSLLPINSVRPTAQKAMVSKFTLHTSSLPKPQHAVPISITPHYAMDTKVAKQAANTTTKRGFQAAQREISTDSGISSISAMDNGPSRTSPQRIRTRPRNLEMVMSGRHKFSVRDRDLDDSLSDDSVVPLALPELPSAFNTFNTSHQPVNITYVLDIYLFKLLFFLHSEIYYYNFVVALFGFEMCFSFRPLAIIIAIINYLWFFLFFIFRLAVWSGTNIRNEMRQRHVHSTMAQSLVDTFYRPP